MIMRFKNDADRGEPKKTAKSGYAGKSSDRNGRMVSNIT